MKSTVLVTGATSGIGEAICRRLIEHQFYVIGAARKLEKLEAMRLELGNSFCPASLDVTDEQSIQQALGSLPEKFRPIDVLINSAGHDIGGRQSFEKGLSRQWCDIIETNVQGLIRVTHLVIDGMLQRGQGHILNLGSIAGLKPYATGTAYVASKFAVHGFSESLRLDYAGRGIRVTEIMPGLVRSNFASRRLDDEHKGAEFYDSFDTCLEPADIAGIVLFALQQPRHVEIAQLVVLPVS